MDWVKLGVRYFMDTKIRGLNGDLADAAEIMFVRSVAWAGEVQADGFIPEQDVALLTRRRRHEAVVDVLVALGLWVAVPGGYRVQRWPDWNGDNMDALMRRRAADRERQRRRRERAKQPTDNMSRDTSRDITVAEGEGEVEVVKGGSTSRSPAARAGPPPRQCQRHINDTDPPQCGPCRDARLAHEAWQRDQAATAAQRQRSAPRCPTHPTEPDDHCAPCRSERLARTEPT